MKQMSLRLTDEQFERLEALSAVHGTNKTRLLAMMIDAEYDALNDSPKMREALRRLQELGDWLKSMGQGES